MITIPAKYTKLSQGVSIVAILILLAYGIAINLESASASQRYRVTGDFADGSVKIQSCLTMMEGVTAEMRWQKDETVVAVQRQKMNIVDKWLNCAPTGSLRA